MNEDTIFFQELFYGEMGYVAKCEHIEVNNNVRIYYKKHNTSVIGTRNGFNFCAVEK